MTDIDFTPQWYRVRQHSTQNRRRRIGFLGTACLLMIFWGVINEGRIQMARSELQDSRESHAHISKLRERIASMKGEIHTLEAQHDRYKVYLKHLPPSVVFAELSHCVPENVSLASFYIHPLKGSASSPGQQPSSYCDQTVRITARALSSEDMFLFIRNLNDSVLFRQVYSGGTRTVEALGSVVKEKIVDLYVLCAEYIQP